MKNFEFEPRQKLAEKAFKRGYTPSKEPAKNAWQISRAFASEHKDQVQQALLYGIKPETYPETNRVFDSFSRTNGDQLIINATGDLDAQRAIIRKLGWDPGLKNPSNATNLVIIPENKKQRALPKLIDYTQEKAGPDQKREIFVLEEDLKILTKTEELFQKNELTKDNNNNIHYVLINRNGKNNKLPENYNEISSITEYEDLVNKERKEKPAIHIIGINNVIVDERALENSRKKAVIETFTKNTIFEPTSVYHAKRLPDFHLLDNEHKFVPLPRDKQKPLDPLTSNGAQASISVFIDKNGDKKLIKKLVSEDKSRPKDSKWQELGGFNGTTELIEQLKEYRQKLIKAGLPLPKNAEFYPARFPDGTFFPVEVVEYCGENLEKVFIKGTDQEKKNTVKGILDASYPVFMAKDLGADVKPANFVKNEKGELFHIDGFPVIMKEDKTGEIITEWPRIPNPEIQNFLYKTHLTPQAIGYRFYQELCQLDPASRSKYKEWIGETLNEWKKDKKITNDVAHETGNAMSPKTSEKLEQILKGQENPVSGFKEISTELYNYTLRNEHPIYALRELSFVMSEYILNNKLDIKELSNEALGLVKERLTDEQATKIGKRVSNARPEASYLTVIRGLTHLSSDNWQVGKEENLALDIIKNTAEKIRKSPMPKEITHTKEAFNNNMPTTAELLGMNSNTIIECRLPILNIPGYRNIIERNPLKFIADGIEVATDPSATHVIVPDKIDPDFLEYANKLTGRDPANVHKIKAENLMPDVIQKIMTKNKGARYYGMWPIEGLKFTQQVTHPDNQKFANENSGLADYIPEKYLPPGWKLFSSSEIVDMTEEDFQKIKGDDEQIWIKTASWNLHKHGIKNYQSLKEVKEYAQVIQKYGIDDQVVIESHLPGPESNFSLIKTSKGEIVVSSVQDQIGSNPNEKYTTSFNKAPEDLKELIGDTGEAIKKHPELTVGFYEFDVIRDNQGKPHISDSAGRKSLAIPLAMQRYDWISRHQEINPDNVYASQLNLSLKKGMNFKEVINKIGDYIEYNDGRQVIVSSHVNTENETVLKLSLFSAHNQTQDLENMKTELKASFSQ